MAEKYKVLRELRYPADAAELAKRVKDKTAKIRWKDVKVGSIVSDIPAISLPWLLEQGCIQPVGASEKKVAPSDKEEEG